MSCFISDLRICEKIDVIWCNLPKMGLIRIFFSNVYSPGEGRKLKDCITDGRGCLIVRFCSTLGTVEKLKSPSAESIWESPKHPRTHAEDPWNTCQLLEAMLWTLLCLFPMWKRTTRLEFSLYQLPLRPFKGNPQAAGLTEQGLISLSCLTCSVNEVGMSKNARHKYFTILSNEDGSIPITYRYLSILIFIFGGD